jgi:hypothetical protein
MEAQLWNPQQCWYTGVLAELQQLNAKEYGSVEHQMSPASRSAH